MYIKHGAYYGQWRTPRTAAAPIAGIGPVRRAGTTEGLTRAQAERRLRELIDEVQVTSRRPSRTVAHAAQRFISST